MWNYEIYNILKKDRDKGKASLIEFERLLPPHLHSLVYHEQKTKFFQLVLIINNTVYKIWN